MTYGAYGNLMRAQNTSTTVVAKYAKDAFGHRAIKDVNGDKTIFLNAGYAQIEAYDVNNSTASSTIYEPGMDKPLAEVNSSGNVTFYHQDRLGSIVLLSDVRGATLEKYTYDAWGEFEAVDAINNPVSVSAVKARFLYTGREYDKETGWYYCRARSYSPELGRFVSFDPIGEAGGINLYGYVGNSPFNFSDPLGLCDEESYDWDYFLFDLASGLLTIADFVALGPSGEGIISALAIQAAKKTAKEFARESKKKVTQLKEEIKKATREKDNQSPEVKKNYKMN